MVIIFVQSPARGSKWLGGWVTSKTRDGMTIVHEDVDFTSPNESFKVVDHHTLLTVTKLSPPYDTPPLQSDHTESDPTMLNSGENTKDIHHFENPEKYVEGTAWEIDESEVLPDPRPVRPEFHTRYLSLATMIKNQRQWLREWLEFNLMMGIEHIIIYDNVSTDQPLEILQPYIDQGVITYIPWPPKSVPPPAEKFKAGLERWQYTWFRDALETCLDNSWTIHQQGPCQLAAFADAVRRTKNGVSRWLAILMNIFFLGRRHSALLFRGY